jgi:hypothetical protein
LLLLLTRTLSIRGWVSKIYLFPSYTYDRFRPCLRDSSDGKQSIWLWKSED